MNPVKTGDLICRLRKQHQWTQRELADRLGVSDKAISKWERGLGCPDVASLNAVAAVLGVNVSELFTGEAIPSNNRAGNLRRTNFYVCPVCGNVVASTGTLFLSCCGWQLTPLAAKDAADELHTPVAEPVEDEVYITLPHPMTKAHFITFIACVTSDKLQLTKLYPEQEAAVRFKRSGRGELYFCCSRDGLFRLRF